MVDISTLEGWLLKKKEKGKSFNFLGSDTKRWFKVQSVESFDEEELALCYFKSNKVKEPSGWMFLKDISDIVESGESFILISPARTLTLEAQTKAEQRLWLEGLVELCPHASAQLLSVSVPKPKAPAKSSNVVEKRADKNRGRDDSSVGEQGVGRKAPPKRGDEYSSTSDRRLERESDYGRDGGRENDFDRPRDVDRRRGDSREGRRDGPRFDNTAATTRLHEHIRSNSGNRESPFDDERGGRRRQHSEEFRRRGDDDDEAVLERPSLRRQVTEEEEDDEELGDRHRGRHGHARRNRRDMAEEENEAEEGGGSGGVRRPGKGPDARGRNKVGDNELDRIVSIPPLAVRASRALEDDEEDDDSPIDFKAEKQKYARSTQGEDPVAMLPGSRPPRHPAQVPAAKSKANAGSGQRTLDPGVKADDDYINEDWDDGQVPSPEAKGAQGARSKSFNAGVRSDQGWLDEDFDD